MHGFALSDTKLHVFFYQEFVEIARSRVKTSPIKMKSDVELNINDITTFHNCYYVYARFVVYAEIEDNFRYDGFIYERSGLLYWMLSQTGVMLSDVIFIMSDRIVPGNGAAPR
jgi:hypothetical protein